MPCKTRSLDKDYYILGLVDFVIFWRPSVDEEGILSWVMSKDKNPPAPVLIKGQDGYTPIKGVDYDDGKDGEGVSSSTSGRVSSNCRTKFGFQFVAWYSVSFAVLSLSSQ